MTKTIGFLMVVVSGLVVGHAHSAAAFIGAILLLIGVWLVAL